MSQSDSLNTTAGRIVAIRLKVTSKKYIFRALLSLASAALLVRLMGMLNQIVVSSHFGAGAAMDAYFIASTLPLVLAQVIINTFQGSVIPTFTRIRTEGKKEQAIVLFSTLLNLLLVGIALLVLAMIIFRQQIVFISAPALDSFRIGLAINLAPFIYPVLLLMTVIGFLECILNTEGQFGWPAYAGLIVPLATAALVLLLGNSQGVIMLCIGMLVGLCLQLGIFIVGARRAGLVYRPILNLRTPEVGAIFSAAWPIFFGSVISQASPLVDQVFASFLSTGSISALNYALKITSVFSGVVFGAVGRAALPYLSCQATNDIKDFKETLRLYIWLITICTTLLSIFMIVLAHPIVQLLFQRGAFSADDTNRTATTLVGFLVGLTPMAFGFVTFTVFSALGKTQVLMRLAIFSVVANALFDYIFARFWQSLGIALSTSAVYFCSMFIMLFILRRTIGKLDLLTPPPEILQAIRKIGISQYYQWLITWKESNLSLFGISSRLRQRIIQLAIMIIVFAVGVVGVLLNSLYTLRIVLGLVVMLVLLRYPYFLLIAWALINAPNAISVFRGSNVLIGLTIPTVLLIACVPLKQTFKRMSALAFFLLYLLWALASIGVSSLGVPTFLTYWTELLDCVLVAILTINLLTTRRRILGLIDAILLVTTCIALYGIYGYFTKQNGIVDTTTSLFRITSIFSAPPGLALLLSIVIPMALYRTSTWRGFMRIIGLMIIFILLIAIGLTFTRAAFIDLPASIAIMAFFLPSRRLKVSLLSGMVGLAALAILVATVANVPIFDRFFGQDIATLNGRTYLWQALLNNFDPTQLLGNGLYASNVLLLNLHVGVNGQGVIAAAPHSIWLGALYDHGIIGLILLILLYIALFINLIAGVRKATGEHRFVFSSALAVFVIIALQSLDSGDFWDQAISIYIWFALSLPFAVYWLPSEQPPKPDEDFLDENATEPRLKAIQQVKQPVPVAIVEEENSVK